MCFFRARITSLPPNVIYMQRTDAMHMQCENLFEIPMESLILQ